MSMHATLTFLCILTLFTLFYTYSVYMLSLALIKSKLQYLVGKLKSDTNTCTLLHTHT